MDFPITITKDLLEEKVDVSDHNSTLSTALYTAPSVPTTMTHLFEYSIVLFVVVVLFWRWYWSFLVSQKHMELKETEEKFQRPSECSTNHNNTTQSTLTTDDTTPSPPKKLSEDSLGCFSVVFNDDIRVQALFNTKVTESTVSGDLTQKLCVPVFYEDHNLASLGFTLGEHYFDHSSATLTFNVPLLDQEFTHTFTINEHKIGNYLVLGTDFFNSNGIDTKYLNGIAPVSNHLDLLSTEQVEELASKYAKPPLGIPPKRAKFDYRFTLRAPISTLKPRALPELSLPQQSFLHEEISRLLQSQIVREVPATTYYSVPTVVPKAESGLFRLAIDYRQLNRITDPLPVSVTPFRNFLACLCRAHVLSTLELSKSHHYIRLDPETAPYSTFRTATGYYAYQVLPFGLTDTPEVHHRFLVHTLRRHRAYVLCHSNKMLVFSSEPGQHLQHLNSVLQTLEKHRLLVDFKRSHLAKTRVEWVGRTITCTANSPQISPSTLENIRKLPRPTTRAQLQSFLRIVASISSFMPNCAQTCAPLVALLQKDKHFSWTPDCETAFHTLRSLNTSQLTVIAFDNTKPIKISTEVSGCAVGAVLSQQVSGPNSLWFPVECRSRKLLKHQLHWPSADKELFAVLLAVRKFRFYLRDQRRFLETESHEVMSMIENGHSECPRKKRWLQEISTHRLVMWDSQSRD